LAVDKAKEVCDEEEEGEDEDGEDDDDEGEDAEEDAEKFTGKGLAVDKAKEVCDEEEEGEDEDDDGEEEDAEADVEEDIEDEDEDASTVKEEDELEDDVEEGEDEDDDDEEEEEEADVVADRVEESSGFEEEEEEEEVGEEAVVFCFLLVSLCGSSESVSGAFLFLGLRPPRALGLPPPLPGGLPPSLPGGLPPPLPGGLPPRLPLEFLLIWEDKKGEKRGRSKRYGKRKNQTEIQLTHLNTIKYLGKTGSCYVVPRLVKFGFVAVHHWPFFDFWTPPNSSCHAGTSYPLLNCILIFIFALLFIFRFILFFSFFFLSQWAMSSSHDLLRLQSRTPQLLPITELKDEVSLPFYLPFAFCFWSKASSVCLSSKQTTYLGFPNKTLKSDSKLPRLDSRVSKMITLILYVVGQYL
jgi:hypothetical protein